MNKRSILIAALLFVMAFTVRLLPTTVSGLPFNIDGFPLAKISEMIIAGGHIPDHGQYSGLLGYNMKLPVFSVLLSQMSLLTGIAPLELLPYFTAFIGSFSVVIIYAFVLKIFRNQTVAFLAGVFLAFTGLFVYVTTAAMKELIGIVILCLLVYTYSLRKDWRHRFVSAGLLLFLPFVHHLTALVAFITVSMISIYSILASNKHEEKFFRYSALEIITGPGLGFVALLYYRAVGMEFFSDVSNLNDAALLFSVCIMALLAHILISQPVTSKPWFVLPERTKKGELTLFALFDEKVLIVLVGIFAMYANSRISLFSSAPKTSELLLDLMIPYFVLALFGLAGLNLLRYSKFEHKPVIIAMFLAPLAIMTFSVFRGLDIYNFTLTFRAYNFIDIPLAIAAGMGSAYLIKIFGGMAKERHPGLMAIPVSVFLAFCLLCIACVPLAYERVEAFGVQETTYEYELEALGWAARHNITNISSDQRYVDIIEPYYEVNGDWTLLWRLERGHVLENETIVAADYWTTIGAQMNIIERIPLPEDSFKSFTNSTSLIYSGGPQDNLIYVLKTD